MEKSRKIVLSVAPESESKLDAFVEDCIRDGVNFIAVYGANASRIDDMIDEIVVGNGSDDRRNILTSFHPKESLDEVVKFARSLTGEFAGDDIKIVKL